MAQEATPYASLRVARAAGKCRYSVETATLSRCATSLTEIDGSASRARAAARSLANRAGGRPPARDLPLLKTSR